MLLQGDRLLAREQIALPPAIDADRLKEHHAALDALGQIANEVVGKAASIIATVGFSAAGVAKDPVIRLRKVYCSGTSPP